jgi:hypothetical protein
MNSLVRFVQFKIPLAQIISRPAESAARFEAVDALRLRIERADTDFEDDGLRVIVKQQRALWQEGVRAARFLSGTAGPPLPVEEENGGDQDEE